MTIATSPGDRVRTTLAACGAVFLALAVSACDSDSSAAPPDTSPKASGNASPGASSGSGSPGGSSDTASPGSATRTFGFSGKKLVIDSDGTGVDIVPGDVTGVRVKRELHGDGVEASWKLSGDTLTLRAKVDCHGNVTQCSARHTVTVGRDVAVTARSGTGSVTASHVTTPLAISTTTGDATVSDSSGPVDLSAHTGVVSGSGLTAKKVTAKADTGSVRLSFSAVPDDVTVDGRNGAVTIGLPTKGARYVVDAGTKVGKTDVGVPKGTGSAHSVRAHTSVGDISVHGN